MFLFVPVIGLVILFIVNFIAVRKDFYGKFSWFDKVIHFLGGFFVAMFLSGLIQSLLLIVGLTLLVGIFWEIYEYLANVYKLRKSSTKKYKVEIRDIVEDIFYGILGAIVWVLIIGIFNIY